jgi:4-amino-4-deoxy-L-arabinose transferase-like glycosyltransferase
VLLFAMIGLPWYGAMTLTHGRAYLESFFVGDNLERFATARFAGRTTSSWWFYGPVLLGGLVPWTIYAIAFAFDRFAGRARNRWQFTSEQWRLLLWAAMPLIFFTLSLGKQPRYILPVLPPLAILIAQSFTRRAADTVARQRALGIATWFTAALFVMTGLLLVRARPLFITSYAIVTTLGVALLFAWGAALAVVAARRRWPRLPVLMPLAAATLLLTLQFGVLAGARPEPVEQMARLVGAYRVSNEPVGECAVFVRNLVFYAGYRQERELCAVDQHAAVAFLHSPGRVFLVVRQRDVASLRSAGATARELGRVDYVDTANVKLRTLLWPDPSRDIETVVLVTNQ